MHQSWSWTTSRQPCLTRHDQRRQPVDHGRPDPVPRQWCSGRQWSPYPFPLLLLPTHLAESRVGRPLPTTAETSLSGHFRINDGSGLLGPPSTWPAVNRLTVTVAAVNRSTTTHSDDES